jgi:UDP-N-acetylglucosamine:LPS N-acetylglucosamine transferase
MVTSLIITKTKNLIQECSKLDSKGVKWLMTQADTESIRHLFKEYKIEEMKVYRMRRYYRIDYKKLLVNYIEIF